MILFASTEFGFLELPDEYSTGSSLMPQKKNPDAWELIRGKTGRIYGALVALFTTTKGLPSSYQRDLQEDKEAFFAAHDQALAMVQIAAATLAATRFREERLCEAAQDPALVATEVADYLVAFGVPFREAHEIVGKVLRAAEKEGKSHPRNAAGEPEGVFARVWARSSLVAHRRCGSGASLSCRRNGPRRGARCVGGFQDARLKKLEENP